MVVVKEALELVQFHLDGRLVGIITVLEFNFDRIRLFGSSAVAEPEADDGFHLCHMGGHEGVDHLQPAGGIHNGPSPLMFALL